MNRFLDSAGRRHARRTIPAGSISAGMTLVTLQMEEKRPTSSDKTAESRLRPGLAAGRFTSVQFKMGQVKFLETRSSDRSVDAADTTSVCGTLLEPFFHEGVGLD